MRQHLSCPLKEEAGDEGGLGVRVQARKGLECQVRNYGIWPPFAGREPREEATHPTPTLGLRADPPDDAWNPPPTPSDLWSPTCP